MKKILIPVFVMCCLIHGVFTAELESKISFWDQQQKGANVFNRYVSRDLIKAAKAYGIKFIRLSPDKFLSKSRDFLIGNVDEYKALVQNDFDILEKILNICADEKMSVVLTMLSLPGSRWKQNNHGKDDLRIYEDSNFQKQAAKFWQDLAVKLRSHKAIVGYNILNEPHPERINSSDAMDVSEINQNAVQQNLFAFYQLVIDAIRAVDKSTPIILDSSAYADPKTFKNLKKHNDSKVLYSFHMYEPYIYTNCKINKASFIYPGKIGNLYWNRSALKDYMKSVTLFQKNSKIHSSRILVGEFGGHRTTKGLDKYFKDLLEIFNENSWHYAFYAFREDVWDGMDYELGDKKIPWSYYKAIEKGETPQLVRNPNHPNFKVLLESF